MKQATKFAISSKWKLLLLDMKVDPVTVLKYAQLPADLFSRQSIGLTTDEYFRLWRGIELTAGEREAPLLFAKYVSAESFDAPIFAALCCNNLNMALDRLRHYKPLIGPMTMILNQTTSSTTLTIHCTVNTDGMPYALSLSEAIFFTQLARIGTRETIKPHSVTVTQLPHDIQAYREYFGCDVTLGKQLSISFNSIDANKPFLTSSANMWEFFEDKLNKKLADMTSTATMSQRVKATLIEALPTGDVSIDTVAKKLAISKRTLQRKLTDDAENFQSILLDVREQLALHYLKKSEISLGEISYLLGFKEPNSFIRAFSSWQGISPNHYRQQIRN